MGLSWVKMMHRWVPSEFNAGDGSTVFDSSSSKRLMHVLAALGSKVASSCLPKGHCCNQ